VAEFQAGEVVVPVIPSAKTFSADLKRQIMPGIPKLGHEIGQQLQQGIQSQLKDIRLQAGLDTSAAVGEVARLRSQLAALGGQSARVRVDADTSAASAGLAAVAAEAQRVDGRTANVQVDADTGGALGQLATADAEISRLDGRTANARVDVDVAGALAAIGLVTAALAAVPLAATAALGAGALGGAFAAAGAGLAGLAAVAGPSLGRINEALKEQEKNAQGAASGLTAAASATRNLAIEAAQAQIKQLQAANAADQMRSAQERVKDAVSGVADAKKRLSSAVAAAAQAQVAAAQRASQAERSLADAQRGAIKAQENLNKARRQAIKDLQSMAQRAKGNALDQREAALDLVDAERELAAARKKGKPEDIERAEIAYERVKLRVEELRTEQENLAEEQAKGIEGNDQVVAAKEAVAAANERVIEQEKQLAAAYAEAGKAGEEAAKRVAEARKGVKDAEERVDDAKRALEQQKRQQKIAELQERIRREQAKDQAKRQADATKRAAAAASAAAAKSGAKTAKLSPAEAIAAKQVKAFKDAYEAFQKELGPAVLPVITTGLDVVQKLFTPLTPLIKGSAGALVELEKAASKALGGKFWTTFFKDLTKEAPTAIGGLGRSFGNIIKGIAGIVQAFLPFTGTIVGGLEKVTAAFARWGTNLGKSEGFKAFIGYVRSNWPTIQTIFTNLVAAVKNVVSSLAPLGSTVLATISGIFRIIATLDPATIRGIAVAIGAVVVALKLWAIAQRVLNIVLAANPIGLIVAAIGLVVGAVIAAYHAFPEFKAVVDAAFQGISAVVTWAWETVIKPALEALRAFAVNVLAPAITWLWHNVIVPAWTGIATVVTTAWNTVIKPALQALWNFITTVLAPKIAWLFENVIKPVFEKIGTVIKTAWTLVIQPALKALWSFITETLAPKITWLYETIVKPVFTKFGEVIKAAWENVIKPALTALWKFVTEDIPNGFKKGVGLIEGFWNGLKEIARKPVQFIVETVYNNGIVKVWNAVAKALKLPELAPIAFAKGGIYPGYTPGRDVGMAAVSGGEAIMRPEWTKAVGEDYVHGANKAARKGGVGGVARFLGVAGDPGVGFAGAFAGGGIVGDIADILAGGIKLGAETLLNPLLAKASSAMGDSPWAQMLTAIPKTLIGGVINFLGAKEDEMGGVGAGKAVAFARAQLDKPYEWGATGPATYDCSGLTMRALQAAGLTDVPRVTYDQINYGKAVSTPRVGDLGFPSDGHVWLYSSASKIIEAPYTGASVREVAARGTIAIRRPTYDSGGYLPPGESLVYNGTGRPEPVLTDQQWRAVQQGGGSRGSDGPMVNVAGDFITRENQTPAQIAQELSWLARSRG
jgi:hypothetical protein